MAMSRESSFLPTIKCSQCGNQVEISMMGEHICRSDSSAPLSPPLETDEACFGTQQRLEPPAQYGRYSGKPGPLDTRAANQAFMRQGPPTPTSHNGDSPTTPFGASGESYTVSPMTTRRPNGYGGLGSQTGHLSESLSSPGLDVMQRMETITPGPFDHRRPSAAGSISPLRQNSLTPSVGYFDERPGTASSNLSGTSIDSSGQLRAPKKNAYEGFGPPSRSDEFESAQLGNLIRSETFPRPSYAANPPSRTPSAPGTRDDRTRQSAGYVAARRPSMGPDTSRRPPPRKSLIPPARKNTGSVDLAREFGTSNPYHTPSDSASSGFSSFSQPSNPSSQTSPARSQARRQASDSSNLDDLMEEVQMNINSLSTSGQLPEPKGPPRTQSPMAISPSGISPADVQLPSSYGQLSPSQPPRLSPHRSQDLPRVEPRFTPRDSSLSSQLGTSPSSSSLRDPPSRQGSGDGIYRGDCKSCGLPIKGKSVSSADGRLTGKYHKPCFVCTTCSAPFTSAEFYVLGDKPYCEQHYHELNGSLCGGCGRGIEGQYVADETSVKYHVGCFCCLDCGRSLSDGYFEVDGRAYCEEDAWHRANAAPTAPAPGSYPPTQDPYAYRQAPPPGARHLPPSRSGGMPGGAMSPWPRNGRPGLPGRPGPAPGQGGPRPRVAGPGMPRLNNGPPSARRPGPGMGMGMGMPQGKVGLAPRPMMNKRSTRVGMMGA